MGHEGVELKDFERLDEDFDYEGKYLINHTKKQYIDFSGLAENDGWKIYPVSLMTAIGNGNGGGDYRGNDVELVGTWAFDSISIEDEIPDGFEKINPQFFE